MLAVVGLGVAGRRRLGTVALRALGVVAAVGPARRAGEYVPVQTPPETVEPARRGPAGCGRSDSIRIDIPPNSAQLWAAYMLHRQPLSASRPVVGTTYPELPFSRKADYVLVQRGSPAGAAPAARC